MKHLTAMVKDTVLASGIAAWDTNRRHAVTARTTRALTQLIEQSALRGLDEQVIGGFFKLSAREPHRLNKLVDSIVGCRLPQVAMALVAYNAEH